MAINLITETLKEIAISNKDSQKKQLSAANSETQLVCSYFYKFQNNFLLCIL